MGSVAARSACEQSFATTLDAVGLFLVSDEDSVVVLDTGATASPVCFRWLERQNRILEGRGRQKVLTYPSSASLRLHDGSLGEVRHAADNPADTSEKEGKLTAFATMIVSA